MKKKIVFTILIIGLSSIIVRILLLREFLIRFYGNELSIGIILANWLIIEAAGAFFFSKRIERLKKRIEVFVALQLIFSLSLPLIIYLVRILNTIVGLTPGEGLGVVFIFWSSFVLLFPICLSYGLIFVLACKIYSLEGAAKYSKVIGKLYIYQAIGVIIGGVVFTYFLIRYFNSFQIAFVIILLNIFVCLLLSTKITRYICYLLLFLDIFLIFKADSIHWYSVNRQWPGENVVYYQNSNYGNVAVSEKDKQYTFFNNGIPAFTLPVPNISFVEEFTHLTLLSHPAPKNILLLTNGAGGLIDEMLKHAIERIDYCEIDPLIIKAARIFPDKITQKELNSTNVKIHYVDSRFFLNTAKNKYDVIIIGSSNPSSLQTNRLFTEEFFEEAKTKLNENGILAISLVGSSSFLGLELKKLNSCIYNTLRQKFSYVKVIPGDINIFISCDSKSIYDNINALSLTGRLKERNLKTSLITGKYIEYKLRQDFQSWYLESIGKIKTNLNKDFIPIAVFYSLSYWNALFSPHTQKMLGLLEKMNLSIFIVVVVILAFLSKKKPLAFAVMATGFCGIVFDLILIFIFQVFYGAAYYWAGILITFFMAGIAAGSLKITLNLEKIKNDFTYFLKLELAIVVFSIILPFILIRMKTYVNYHNIYTIIQMLFLGLSFVSGFLVGAEFPLANKIYLKNHPNISQTAGSLYAADLFGGWVGGILGGVVLLPILGLFKTCMLMVVLKISGFAILVWYNKNYDET